MRSRAAILLATGLAALAPDAVAQSPAESEGSPPPKRSLFKDPEDGAFDVGGWIATRTGIRLRHLRELVVMARSPGEEA